MLFEPTEHEPDEYDPEADLEDPDADGVTIPSVSSPEADFEDPDADGLTIPSVATPEEDVPSELAATFWIVVVVVNAAVLALSLGALLLAFRGDVTRGGALLAGGIVLLAMAARRYRAFDDYSSAGPAGVSHEPGDGGSERTGADSEGTETVSGAERVADPPEESHSHDENGT